MPHKSRVMLYLFLFCLIFSGCSRIQRKEVSSPATVPNSFSNSGTNLLPEKWWESFGDPQLNTLTEQALGQNFTIRAAWDRLSQAEQIAIKSGAALLPSADYLANVRRTRQEISNDVSYTPNYSLGLIVSYEVDLWGRVRSSQQAGIVGAVVGHMIMGYSLSVMSMMGIVALSGVVVNDSLLLIDYANNLRRKNPELNAFDAIHQAGVRRFRPIMLTTLTTFGGLTPMIFETSRQARFMIPMALSLGYGILFATAITLIIVPCLYMIIDDCTRKYTVLASFIEQ